MLFCSLWLFVQLVLLWKSIYTYFYVYVRMTKEDHRVKLTITINSGILEAAKKEAKSKNLPLSRVIENFLRFFVDPEVYCFVCGEKFKVKKAELCSRCGWLVCPKCGACRCKLGDEAASAVFYMRKVYEDLLVGRVE